MRVVYNDWITEEMKAAFKSEKTVYLSTDREKWLFTDMEVFNEMDKKFQFDIETEEREHVFNVDIKEYINITYECNSFEYFGYNIELLDYIECVLEVIDEDGLEGNDWDKTIDELLKTSVMVEVIEQMKTTFLKMSNDGYDLSEVCELIEYVKKETSK